MKKKSMALLLTGVMALSLAACGSTASTSAAPAAESKAEEAAPEETEAAASESTAAESAATEDTATVVDPATAGPIMKDIIENGVLKVGIIGNDPTFCFHSVVDGEDQLVGFEVEGMKEMAKRLGDYLGREVTVEFTETDFTGAMSALQAGQVYFVTRLSPTDERKETWLFTDVYHKSNECYVALKENADSEKFSGTLEGVTVAGAMGSIDITMTRHLYPDAEIQELGGTPDILLAVKNGKAELGCMNAVVAAMSCMANPDLTIVDSLTWEPTDEFDKGCGLCMAYGNEDFAEWANGFFSDIKAEGLWDQMQEDAAALLTADALADYAVE